MFEALFVSPWPWYVAGPLIGLYAAAFFYFQGRNLGASSAFPAVMEALRGQDDPHSPDFGSLDDPLRLPTQHRDPAPRWRVWWLGGLLAAGLLGWALGGEGAGTLLLPGLAEFFAGLPVWGLVLLLFVGGVAIGFGTRMSGGCTSGHAIFGISQLQLPSIYATLTFMAVGMAVTRLLHAWFSR